MSKQQWQASAEQEDYKLSPKERDWALPGMGETPMRRTRKKRHFLGDSSSESEYEDDSSDDVDNCA